MITSKLILQGLAFGTLFFITDLMAGFLGASLVGLFILIPIYRVQPYQGGFDGGVLLLLIAFIVAGYLMHDFNERMWGDFFG